MSPICYLGSGDTPNADLREENERLLDMIARLSEHPEGYEVPCLCSECALGNDVDGR